MCTFSILSWAEGSGKADMKPYRETRSKLVRYLEMYDNLSVSTAAV